jgi:hypothetical protein
MPWSGILTAHISFLPSLRPISNGWICTFKCQTFPGREALTTDPLRHRKASQNVTDNPHITAEYLACRFKAFDKVIKRVLPVADYWYRFEWQQRGSGHIHGFLWLHSEPNPSTVDEMARQRIVDYWGPRVTVMNPHHTQF